ncbi:DoxX family protein [Hymenobacter amundsenii]|uniref:DoxX family protein n=1 Tax=Hymenobacter amundsenii TaxID=2006685 RepID=A0A246FMK5_9BACT|nr:DoxX family protein [Hymenobacter amundsenii]OWP63971.1 DoxX family protein [Hymenobacter amundsenii]
MSASTRNVLAWILQVLLGLAFIASGGNKFRDLAGTIGMFESLGLPAVMAYVVAGAEVLGGIGLLIPRFVRPAALGLILIMLGAVVMHATKIPGGLAGGAPAIVLLVLLAVLLWLRKPAVAVR